MAKKRKAGYKRPGANAAWGSINSSRQFKRYRKKVNKRAGKFF